MFFQQDFIQKLQAFNVSAKTSFLLAVSGGVDSMVLLWLFAKSGVNFQVAHINYKLRGKDSDLDQKLVEDFCKENAIKLHIYQVSEKDQKPKGSIQLWARELRYSFFKEIQINENLDFLVTAHHLNDQLETFFINLSRGSGLTGLGGIPCNNKIFRPLLDFSKEEIYAFAKENNVPSREDISNQKNDYLRNKFRNKIIPELIEVSPNFLFNFKKSIDILSQTRDFVSRQIEQILESLTIEKTEYYWVLDKEKLSREDFFVQFEILKKFGFHQENEIPKIFIAETGKCFLSKEFSLLIDREKIILEPNLENEKYEKELEIEYLENEDIIIIKDIGLKTLKDKSWLFDKKKIKLPLKIRKRKEGDIFYPIGMLGKKKVSKFLKDEKLSVLDKEKIRILCDADDNILGVFPLRQDRRFMGNTIKLLF